MRKLMDTFWSLPRGETHMGRLRAALYAGEIADPFTQQRILDMAAAPVMKRVLDHVDGHLLEVDGAQLYCEEAGNPRGPSLVLLHGGFGTMEDFNPLVQALADEFHVLAIDLRGHGRSTLGHERLSYARLAQDVTQVLAKKRISNATLVGMHDGGVVAYRVASQTDSGISRTVAIGAPWQASQCTTMRSDLAQLTGARWRALHPHTYWAYQRLNPTPDFECLTEVMVGLWLDETAAGYPGRAVQHIECPLLIVRGDGDACISRAAATELAELVRGAQLLNVPFTSGAVLQDAPELTVQCIRRFLGESLKV